MKPPYSEIVLDHFYRPRNAFRLADPDVVGRAGTPGRGNYMALYLALEGERITQASFQTYGCCPAIAAGSMLVERIQGQTRAEASAWDEAAICAALGGLPRHKRHCSRLAADALADALGRWAVPDEKLGETPGDRRGDGRGAA